MLSWKCPGKRFPEKGEKKKSALLFITNYRHEKTRQLIVL